jgi:peptidoglycan/xylan/chitin deacetylase (PgdA/CDA1 family)
MYHRVIPQKIADIGVQPGIYVEPDTLRLHIRVLQKFFSIVPISELFYSSKRDDRNSDAGKLRCALTFDDGWYDFYTHAFPILSAHDIPATVFLPSDYIGGTDWFWTDRLAFLFKQRDKLHNLTMSSVTSKNELTSRLLRLKGAFGDQLEEAVMILKPFKREEIEGVLRELSSVWGITPNTSDRLFLSWSEVKKMNDSGIVNFGSHTASHSILTTIEKKEVWEELNRSKSKLVEEGVVDSSFVPLSYPNGNYNAGIAEMAKQAGYSLAVTTEKGWHEQGADLFKMKRMPIHQDITSTEAMFGCRIVGMI